MNNKITSYLIEKGLIQKEDLEKVLNQPLENISIEEHLIHSGFISEEEFCSAAEDFFGVPFATKDDYPKELLLVNNLSIQFMKESRFIPTHLTDKELTVIMGDPLDFYTFEFTNVRSVRYVSGNRNAQGQTIGPSVWIRGNI